MDTKVMNQNRLHERIQVIYEDCDVIVIEKAGGIVSYPVEGHETGTAIQLIRKYWKVRDSMNQNLYLLHRLDKDTSGLMVFAKTSRARATLREQFDRHSIVRGYVAVTSGVPEKRKGEIKTFLGRDSRGKRAVTSNGRFAWTSYQVVAENDIRRRALIRCRLHTGRTHQVRIHLAYIGAPVVGDEVYGRTSGIRLALHADTLAFLHPRSGLPIAFHTSLPLELRALL